MNQDPLLLGSLGILLMLLMVFFRIPIAYALFISGFAGMLWLRGFAAASAILSQTLFSQVASYSLTVIPLFVIVGYLAYSAGVADRAFKVAVLWLNRVPGSLALSTVAGATFFGACSGSSLADAVAIGKAAIPEMLKRGYDKGLATGCVACAGTLAVLIPPSQTLVILAIMMGESVGKTLMAGIVPGILSAIIWMAMIIIWVRLKPSAAPRDTEDVSWGQRIRALPQLWGIGAIFLSIVGGIYAGIVTPTESAAIAAAVAAGLVVIYTKRGQRWHTLRASFWEAGQSIAMVFAILVGALVFTAFLAAAKFPAALTELAIALPFSPQVTLFLATLVFIPFGMFIGGLGSIFVAVPILQPLVEQLGYSNVWFAVIVVKYVEIAVITPPVALVVYGVKAICPPEVTLQDIFRGSWWFLLIEFLTTLLLFAFPVITTFLPDLMG